MKNTLFALLACTAAFSLQPAFAQDGLALFSSKPCVGSIWRGNQPSNPTTRTERAGI